MDIGINCFGLNELIHNDFENTFKSLKEIGFTCVEPMIVFPKALNMDSDMMHQRLIASKKDGAFWTDVIAKQRIAYLRQLGFKVEGFHIGLVSMAKNGLVDYLDYVVDFVKDNDIKYVVHSPQKDSIDAIKIDIEAFKKAKKLLKDGDCEIIFHQHYQEFNIENDTTPFEYLLNEVKDLRIELDVGWLKYVDADILKIMEEYNDRIAVIHLKDIIENHSDYDSDKIFTAIGEGSIPLKEIISKSNDIKTDYCRLIIDQDNSNTDMLKELEIGYHNIQSLLK